ELAYDLDETNRQLRELVGQRDEKQDAYIRMDAEMSEFDKHKDDIVALIEQNIRQPKFREQLALKLKAIVKRILVYPAGFHPIAERSITTIDYLKENADVLKLAGTQYDVERLEAERALFAERLDDRNSSLHVTFKDGSMKIVFPNPDNPYDASWKEVD